MIEETSKIKIYIDGANMFYTQKRFGWSFDWVKIKNHIENIKKILEWKYYEKSSLDEIIIFSGDSDFRYLAKKLKDSGIKTIIFSSRKTISWELKLEASEVFYLEDIKDKIQRE